MTVAERPRLRGDYFDALYAADPDPWDFATSAYERAKYDDTLAALGDRRFVRGLEVGCSIGVLTERLADHCDELVAVDVAQAAVDAAHARLTGRQGVHVLRASLPEQWPSGTFDLVVASEVLYYFDRESLRDAVVPGLVARLRRGGLLLAVHWRPPTDTYPLRGDEVHALLRATPGLAPVLHRVREHYRLDVLERAA